MDEIALVIGPLSKADDILMLHEDHGSTDEEIAPVVEGLRRFNRQHVRAPEPRPLRILLRDEGGVVRGGLVGVTRWHWLLVEALWIEEDYRGKGHGRAMLRRAESVAFERGCRRAALETTDFQALGFYERAGYTPYGELADYPPGSRTFYLKRELSCPAAGP